MTQYFQIAGDPPDSESVTAELTAVGLVLEGMRVRWGARHFVVTNVEPIGTGFLQRVTMRRRRVEPVGVIHVDELTREPNPDQAKLNAQARAAHLRSLRRRRGGY